MRSPRGSTPVLFRRSRAPCNNERAGNMKEGDPFLSGERAIVTQLGKRLGSQSRVIRHASIITRESTDQSGARPPVMRKPFSRNRARDVNKFRLDVQASIKCNARMRAALSEHRILFALFTLFVFSLPRADGVFPNCIYLWMLNYSR